MCTEVGDIVRILGIAIHHGYAEVGDFDVVSPVDEDVVRLDIATHERKAQKETDE